MRAKFILTYTRRTMGWANDATNKYGKRANNVTVVVDRHLRLRHAMKHASQLVSAQAAYLGNVFKVRSIVSIESSRHLPLTLIRGLTVKLLTRRATADVVVRRLQKPLGNVVPRVVVQRKASLFLRAASFRRDDGGVVSLRLH